MDETSYMGEWWDPARPGHKLGGVLTLSESGKSYLKVIGRFSDDWNSRDIPETVLGEAGGKQITLLYCQGANGGRYFLGGLGTATEALQARVALLGAHLPDASAKAFCRLEVEVAYLTLWTGISGVEQTHFFKRDDSGDIDGIGPLDRISVVARPEAAVGCEYDANTDLELVPILTLSTSSDHVWSNGPSFKESIKLQISSGSDRTWDGFNEAASAVCDLMTLASQTPSTLRNRILFVEDRDDTKRPHQVELYMHSGHREPKSVIPHDMAFQRSDLNFDLAIENWRDARERIGMAVDILFSLDYANDSYLENNIFNVATAAEGIHAGLFPDARALNKEDHSRIKSAALAIFSGDDRKWIKERVRGNRPTLRRRLLALCSIPAQDAVNRLLTDRDVWAGWLTKSRNAIGHANTEEFGKAVPEEVLYRLTYVSKALLHLVMMELVGVSHEKQLSATQDNWGYSARVFKKLVDDFKDGR